MGYNANLYFMYKLMLCYVSKYFKYFGIYVDRLLSPHQPLEVYKVIEYVETDYTTKTIEEKTNQGSDDGSEQSSDSVPVMCESDKTKSYFNGNIFRNDINGHLELRLLWKDKKYRWIVDNLNPTFPSYTDFIKNNVTNNIILATLSSKSENECTDVSNRVKKFAGPEEDFFNRNITMSMLFVNDDLHSDHILHILRRNGSLLSYKHCDYVT